MLARGIRSYHRPSRLEEAIDLVKHGAVPLAGGTRLLASALYWVEPFDPATFATVPVVVVAVALLATAVPARRAAGVDPLRALRAE